jgi:integrase
MRRHLLDRGRLRDAVFISTLAFAGPRPGEAIALTWGDVRQRTILVERALALGRVKRTKTERTRTVRLLAPLATDFAELRLAQARPDETALVVLNRARSTSSDVTRRNWRKRVFVRAARASELERSARPDDQRHSFVSLRLGEGATVVEVARQAGHSPTAALSTYAHLFEKLEDQRGARPRRRSGVRGRRAEARVPVLYPEARRPIAERKHLQS